MILPLTVWRDISDAISQIAIMAAMPTIIVWLCLKTKNQRFCERIELAKAALEKNASLDMEDFLAKITPPKKTLAQKSVILILVTSILIFLSIASATVAFVFKSQDIQEAFTLFIAVASVLMGIGLSFLIAFLYTKRLMGKEQQK